MAIKWGFHAILSDFMVHSPACPHLSRRSRQDFLNLTRKGWRDNSLTTQPGGPLHAEFKVFQGTSSWEIHIMGVSKNRDTPNHPKSDYFSIETHGFGVLPFQETSISPGESCNEYQMILDIQYDCSDQSKESTWRSLSFWICQVRTSRKNRTAILGDQGLDE